MPLFCLLSTASISHIDALRYLRIDFNAHLSLIIRASLDIRMLLLTLSKNCSKSIVSHYSYGLVLFTQTIARLRESRIYQEAQFLSDACWTSLSTTAGIPNVLTPSSGFGIFILPIARGRYSSVINTFLMLAQCSFSQSFNTCTLRLSIPAAPLFSITRYKRASYCFFLSPSLLSTAFPLSFSHRPPYRFQHYTAALANSVRYPASGDNILPLCVINRHRVSMS